MAVCHDKGVGWEEVTDLSELSDLRKRGRLLWAEADVRNLQKSDVDLIAEEFDLHPLAVEDALNARQRPKIDTFETHLFVVMHELTEQDDHLEATQIASFVGDSYVLTLHAGAGAALKEARERWGRISSDLKDTPAGLLYTLLDCVVDEYQSAADRIEDGIEELEETTLATLDDSTTIRSTGPHNIERRIYSLKQRTARLRRYALPLGRVLSTLTDGNPEKQISEPVVTLLRDVHDHILRIGDQIRNIDDLATAVLDLRASDQQNQLNEVTKKLTGWAAIIAVPTLISGVYGMNFDLFPKDGEPFGFWFAISLIAISVTWLYVFFKRRGWI